MVWNAIKCYLSVEPLLLASDKCLNLSFNIGRSIYLKGRGLGDNTGKNSIRNRNQRIWLCIWRSTLKFLINSLFVIFQPKLLKWVFEFSYVGNDRRPSQKSGMRRENRNTPATIPGDRECLRFPVFLSRESLGRRVGQQWNPRSSGIWSVITAKFNTWYFAFQTCSSVIQFWYFTIPTVKPAVL